MVMFFIFVLSVSLTISALVAVGIWRVNAVLVGGLQAYRPMLSYALVAAVLLICQAAAWFFAGIIFILGGAA